MEKEEAFWLFPNYELTNYELTNHEYRIHILLLPYQLQNMPNMIALVL